MTESAQRAAGGPWSIAIIILSDKAASGQRPDRCLPEIRAELSAGINSGDYIIAEERVIPDDRAALTALLRELCDVQRVDCVLTSGGTGLSARDVTPQATREVADYEVPGIAEAMRAASAAKVPTAMLSRAVAVVRGHSLIVNLPGSPNGARESLNVISGVLPHALGLLRGVIGEH